MPERFGVVSLVFLALATSSCAPAAKHPVVAQEKPSSLRDIGDNQIIGLDLMSMRDGHGGPQYFPIDGEPVAGYPYVAEVQVFKGASKVLLEVRDSTGKLMTRIPMERTRPPEWSNHTKHWAAQLTLPAQRARLYVTGLMEDGTEFRTGSRHVDAKSIEIRMDYVPSIVGGRPLDYEIEVQNFGPADRFEVTITDDAQFLPAPVKQEVELETKQSRTIRVTLNLPVADQAEPSLEDHLHVTVTSVSQRSTASAFGSVSLLPGRDADADWVGDDIDNCPLLTNASQTDQDQDGMGDECDPEPTKAAKQAKKKG